MKMLKKNYIKLKLTFINIFLIFLLSNNVYSDDINFEIQGNQYTDTSVILSLLDDIPDKVDEVYSNDIINTLNSSKLFSDVSVEINTNKYIIKVKEFPIINKIYFNNNKRLDDEELSLIANHTNLISYNDQSINFFINEIKNIYQSFGYNNININYSEKIDVDLNTVDIYFDFNEGTITKINQIIIDGNQSVSNEDIREIIVSKTKSIINIFANNNFKPSSIERDTNIISNYYKNNGFLDVKVKNKIEYLNNNKVNIYFNINEGNIYSVKSITINDPDKILESIVLDKINIRINEYLINQKVFSIKKIDEFSKELRSIIFETGIEFFELNTFDKKENNEVSILFEISSISPKYAKKINIFGNARTFDYVIRRELKIVEGDAIYSNQIKDIRDHLLSLNLFESVNIKEEFIDENSSNLNIKVEEKQTGTFNAGVSVGTLDGFAIVTGLRERNFWGTGRSLNVLINTSEDKNQFKLITEDRLSFENDANINYSINYKQEDFAKASSYKLDTFSSGVGVGYKLNSNLIHKIDLEYVLKDYKITDVSTVSNSISSSSGTNISYLLKNNISYSTLNPGFISKKGNFINFNNAIETPTSSSNGFVRNILTLKKFYSINNNIFSVQSKLGNIISLNNNDILTDDKFALGGRWLRGFDNYGAGPRNSRSSYIGGNNIAVTKFDFSYELTNNSNFPLYLNLFNDYGLIWENKTKPTNNDNSLRSSAGFGIKYYSPIGPIGFTWGFPIMDEDYDIKRMFLFSVGNID